MSARILVVEDEAIIASDIRATLEELRYEVTSTVGSGSEALATVSSDRPDLVLMDIHLRGPMDGIEVAGRMRTDHGTPVVYLTSYSDDATLERAKQTGAYGFVLKPFTDRDLRTAIEVALEKHQIEARLAEKERWFSTTLNSVGDAVIATDPGQQITFMNPVAERVTGWSASEAAGKPLDQVLRLVHQQTGAPIESPLVRAFREGGAVALPPNTALSVKEGARRVIDDSAAPIVNDRGETLGGVVVFRDVTERRRLEERLAQSDRLAAIGTLSAGMAHEINNPLTYVLANVSYAVDTLPELQQRLGEQRGAGALAAVSLAADVIEALKEAQDGSMRVHRIVHDLRRFGRLDAAERSALELNEVVDGAIRMTDNIVRHHARIRRERGEVPCVEANRGQLSQVFTNLLVNAAQAMGEGSAGSKEIVVATYTDEIGRAVGEVRDCGPGIAPENLRRIFDPFFTTKPIGQGTGLGLSIAHSIVASLGGELTVTSVPGEGAAFKVALPGARARPEAIAAERPAVLGRGRVLVIDDEPAIGRALMRALQLDHDAFVVQDAREALRRIAAGESFDVILCDVMMPEMTGIEFFHALGAANPGLAARVVFITGGAFTEHAEAFLASVPNARMTKPIEPRLLRQLVADRMGGRG